jgi:hypothetical protein
MAITRFAPVSAIYSVRIPLSESTTKWPTTPGVRVRAISGKRRTLARECSSDPG